ncbi:hypothetical protein FRAHR75_410030 [Frankia sp. Hr75.2]|nr:hypothetical protein FRAHR75_410030 [Frankia sp. Hr75.2]
MRGRAQLGRAGHSRTGRRPADLTVPRQNADPVSALGPVRNIPTIPATCPVAIFSRQAGDQRQCRPAATERRVAPTGAPGPAPVPHI